MAPQTADSTDKFEQISRRATKLGELKNHPNWPDLRAEFERKKGLQQRRLLNLLVGRTEAAVLQREIDYIAGFWAGAEWLLDNPDMAEATLERALRQARLIKDGDE